MDNKPARVLKAVPESGNPNSFIPERAGRRANGKLTHEQQNDLIRDLAVDDKTHTELAREYGVTKQYVFRFNRMYAYQIGKLRANVSNEFAHLWIASKVNRVHRLQRMARKIERIENPTSEDIRVYAMLLKNAAEELGQLPPRTQVVSARVTHVIEGISNEELEAYLT